MAGLQPVSDIPDWLLDICSIAYFRLDWASVVDETGKPDFERLDREFFDGYRKRGLRLAFRIMAANPHSRRTDVMPKILLDAGIPTVVHKGVYGEAHRDPAFWNPLYLAEHEKMVRALGLYLDGKTWAGPVDLGGMGDWGEMHLSSWSPQELANQGWTPEVYVLAVRTLMRQMDRHLPNTTKAFCVAPILMPDPEPLFAQIVDQAARRGWWLRSDGCEAPAGAPSYVKPHLARWHDQVGFIAEASGGINRSYQGDKVPVKSYMDGVLGDGPGQLPAEPDRGRQQVLARHEDHVVEQHVSGRQGRAEHEHREAERQHRRERATGHAAMKGRGDWRRCAAWAKPARSRRGQRPCSPHQLPVAVRKVNVRISGSVEYCFTHAALIFQETTLWQGGRIFTRCSFDRMKTVIESAASTTSAK